MKLLDYIRGLRKGKEAHRLEKEAMQDPFLADAMEGYSQVEGNHEQRIEQLQMQVLAHSAKKKNTYAITWSIAACLVIGFGISSYFLFLKKNMADEVFIAKESVPAKMSEPATPITPQKEITSATIKKETDSVPVSEITSKRADKKEMIAKTETTPKPHSAPVTAIPMMDEVAELMVVLEEEAVIMDTSNSEPDKKIKMTKMAAVPNNNMIKGKVTDEKGEPLIGASVIYKGTTVGTVTDINGEFTIAKKEGNKQLTAQYIGYDPVEIPVDTARTMLIALNENEQALSEVVIVADITPQPVIGKRKYQKYLKENLVRPGDDKCKDVKGEVILSFFVDKEGKPQNITVIHGLCESADKEAIRLVKEGPKWTIGKLPARIAVQF